MKYGHLQGPQAGKIQLGLPGVWSWSSMPPLQGWAGLIHQWKGKPRGCWWSSPWHKGIFFWLCSLLWLQFSWLTRGGYTKWFFPCGVSVMRFFLQVQESWDLVDWPSQVRGWGICRALVLLCRTPLGAFQNRWHTSGGQWPATLFLHTAPLNNVEFPGTPSGEDNPFTPTHPGRVKWPTSHLFLAVQLAPWRLQLARWAFLWLGHHQSTHP